MDYEKQNLLLQERIKFEQEQRKKQKEETSDQKDKLMKTISALNSKTKNEKDKIEKNHQIIVTKLESKQRELIE